MQFFVVAYNKLKPMVDTVLCVIQPINKVLQENMILGIGQKVIFKYKSISCNLAIYSD